MSDQTATTSEGSSAYSALLTGLLSADEELYVAWANVKDDPHVDALMRLAIDALGAVRKHCIRKKHQSS